MASSASPDLKIQLMGTGENSGAWGTITNNNLSAIEEAIARTTDVTFANDAPTASVTLTDSNSLQAGRNFRLNLIGTGTAGHVLLLPTVEKSYLINNTLTVDVSVRNGTAAGTNLFNTQTVPAGGAAMVYTDGSAVTSAVSSASAMEVLNALSIGGDASVGGTFKVTGAVTLDSSLSTIGAASAGGGFSDVDGSLRSIPSSRLFTGAAATASALDNGNFILFAGTASSTQVFTLPISADIGTVFTLVNTPYGGKTAAAVTTISAAATAFIAGGEAATANITLATNGVATVLYVTPRGCFITGNVS